MKEFVNPYPKLFSGSTLPEGSNGDWGVSKFSVTGGVRWMMDNLRAVRDCLPHRIVPIGEFTRLICKGRGVVMSDTPAEAWENNTFVANAKGRVLIFGLGMGWVLETILKKPEVTEVLVCESEGEVINMIAPHFAHDRRVQIIHCALEDYFMPEEDHWDCIWVDIWDTICSENKEQMERLSVEWEAHYDWIGFWSYEILEFIDGNLSAEDLADQYGFPFESLEDYV